MKLIRPDGSEYEVEKTTSPSNEGDTTTIQSGNFEKVSVDEDLSDEQIEQMENILLKSFSDVYVSLVKSVMSRLKLQGVQINQMQIMELQDSIMTVLNNTVLLKVLIALGVTDLSQILTEKDFENMKNAFQIEQQPLTPEQLKKAKQNIN